MSKNYYISNDGLKGEISTTTSRYYLDSNKVLYHLFFENCMITKIVINDWNQFKEHGVHFEDNLIIDFSIKVPDTINYLSCDLNALNPEEHLDYSSDIVLHYF